MAQALPKVVEGVATTALRQVVEDHLGQTQGHVDRLERIAHENLIRLGRRPCKAMEELIREIYDAMEEPGDAVVADIAALQRVEQFEVSGCSTVIALSRELRMDEAGELLAQTLDEERRADERLAAVRDGHLLAMAPRRSDRPASPGVWLARDREEATVGVVCD